MPVLGNHDIIGRYEEMDASGPQDNWQSLYHRIFSLPEDGHDGGFYGYTAGNTRLIALNTEMPAPAQTNWLAHELQAAAFDTNITWIIAYGHRPIYSWGERKGDRGHEDYDAFYHWPQLFVMYEADYMLAGHSHNWQRSTPIRGVRYMVIGGGGGRPYASEYDLGKTGNAFATTCYHHASFHITNDVLQVRGIRSDGLVFDTEIVTQQRKVMVSPAFPLRGQPARITYRPREGPLKDAAAVSIHLGQDAFAGEFADAAMTWNAAADCWEYDFTVPNTASQRLAFVFHDGAGTWDNNDEHDWQALLGRATVEPAEPQAGGQVTIHYQPALGPLAGASSISAHVAFNGGRFAIGPVLMADFGGGNMRSMPVSVPSYATDMTVEFSGGAHGQWDNNALHKWTFRVAGATEAGYPPEPVTAAGSPVVTDKPASGMNHIGDNFDLETVGPPLRLLARNIGFGSLGQIWLNADSANLYLGGTNANLGGSNNVFLLFLGVDTLTDDAWNLEHKEGLPNALGHLKNLRFTEPMDVAIVFGDQWGDSADGTDHTYGAYNFGQGIYYLSTNSSALIPLPGAKLSQFGGTGRIPEATDGDENQRRTTRWEAQIPWGALNAGGPEAVSHLHVAGVIGSSTVSGSNRYLSRSMVGTRGWGRLDAYNQFGTNIVQVAPIRVNLPHADVLGDGISNEWRLEHFGTVTGPPADEDSDGDGYTNREEEVAGTDPVDPQSFLTLELAPSAGAGAAPGLAWVQVPGRTYHLYYTADMMQAFQLAVSNLTTNAYFDAVEGFYKLGVSKGCTT